MSLDGSASNDPDNGPLLLSYNWWLNALPANSSSSLVNPTHAMPQLTPDVSGYYIARLEASDGFASGFANTLTRFDSFTAGRAANTDDLPVAALARFQPFGKIHQRAGRQSTLSRIRL